MFFPGKKFIKQQGKSPGYSSLKNLAAELRGMRSQCVFNTIVLHITCQFFFVIVQTGAMPLPRSIQMDFQFMHDFSGAFGKDDYLIGQVKRFVDIMGHQKNGGPRGKENIQNQVLEFFPCKSIH
jgi:hypothetical protein